MAALYGPRLGWENEQLAHYLLSRISFVAHPATVSDDFGVDFYCTIFTVTDLPHPQMEPRLSFAIQVKSSRDDIDASGKVRSFDHLAMPLFIGVVDQEAKSLSIYSAECLPILFAWHGHPEELALRLNDGLAGLQSAHDAVEVLDPEAEEHKKFRLRCGFVCTLTAEEPRAELDQPRRLLLNVCFRASNNLAAKRLNENLYRWPDGSPTAFGGSGSAGFFRQHVMERLTEAFVNLKWIAEYKPDQFRADEFVAYERAVNEMARFQVNSATAWAVGACHDAREFIEARGLLKNSEAASQPSV
jgi:hypothetical protein